MCDQDHFEDDLKKYSRRDLGALAALGIGASILFPDNSLAADAQDSELLEKEVTIKTPDGECDAFFVNPANHAHAAVLVWPDIFGLRPAFRQMAKRLAKSGYSVLVVNPFYRSQKAPTAPQGAGTPIQEVVPMARSLNAKTHQSDATAFVAWLDSQEQVDKTKKIGTIGYCMGGPIVMRTAATVPDRIGAGCSFHGGGLVTKEPDSPHLLIPKMKASFLIAVAENDDQRDPDSKKVLKGAFEQANLSAEIEVYAAGHGWCPPDTKVHNQEQADKAWVRMLALFEKSLA
jgi:carboxymethylenebutenolidase